MKVIKLTLLALCVITLLNLLIKSYDNLREAIGNPTDSRVKYTTGYCSAKGRYLSNEELTDIAVTRLLDNLKEDSLRLSVAEKANRIAYKALAHFYEVNPRCCRVITKPGDWEWGKARLKRYNRTRVYLEHGNAFRNSIISSFNYRSLKQPDEYGQFDRGYYYVMSFCRHHQYPPRYDNFGIDRRSIGSLKPPSRTEGGLDKAPINLDGQQGVER